MRRGQKNISPNAISENACKSRFAQGAARARLLDHRVPVAEGDLPFTQEGDAVRVHLLGESLHPHDVLRRKQIAHGVLLQKETVSGRVTGTGSGNTLGFDVWCVKSGDSLDPTQDPTPVWTQPRPHSKTPLPQGFVQTQTGIRAEDPFIPIRDILYLRGLLFIFPGAKQQTTLVIQTKGIS